MPQIDSPEVSQPTPNQAVIAGQPLSVTGSAQGSVMPELDPIDAVIVAVDNGPPTLALLRVIPGQSRPTVTFSALVQVPSALGPHTIAVTAESANGLSATNTVTVFVAAQPAQAPQHILEIRHANPDQPRDVDALYAQAVALGRQDATFLIGGTFPSFDAEQEWKQVVPSDLTDTAAHEADYEVELVGATGWALNPEFSGADVPFDHPFGFDWEFMLALDQPADDPKRYAFLLTQADQSCDEDGFSDAVQQASDLKDQDGQPIPIPQGPNDLPSLLGVEIDGGLVPQQFTDPLRGGVVPGDRMAVFGRWIVDCGHQVPITACGSPNRDISPGIQAFRTEIHPPLLMAAARVITGSNTIAALDGSKITRVLFTSRPFLVGQRFTTDTDTIYDDTASDDGPFFSHLLKEVAKVNALLSQQVEAHPKIKSKPFHGAYLAHFVVRLPEPIGPESPGRLTVAFQFTHRSGCAVQLISSAPDSVDVLIVLNDVGYTPPRRPERRDRTWTRDELTQLDPRAGTAYLDGQVLSAAVQALTGAVIRAALVEGFLGNGIKTDEYDTDALRSVNMLDASQAVTAFADNIPAEKGIVLDDDQPYPVYGWMEVKFTPAVVSRGGL